MSTSDGSKLALFTKNLKTAVLQQDLNQVDFGLRRFRLRSGPARHKLESAGRSFLTGFNAAVTSSAMDQLAADIEVLEPELRGFAYEGAGMACAVLDLLTLSGGRRLGELLSGPAKHYPHLVHVGVGWAYARLRLRPWWTISVGDPLLRWLAWDGYGFHQGFFHADRVVGRRRVEPFRTPEQRAIRDQGLGRSLWFHECADVDAIVLRVAEFEPERRGDLWSGVGLAATYAGSADPDDLERLVAHADGHRSDLAQGAAFACAARQVSGIVPAHTNAAAPVLTGVTAEEASTWTDVALQALGTSPHTVSDYQRWRAEIRRLWSRQQERYGSWAQ